LFVRVVVKLSNFKDFEGMKTAEFISTFKWYDVEASGQKPYTIRNKTSRAEAKLRGATHIKIRRGYTKDFFVKEITHRLDLKEYIIIAWNPNKEGKE